jgi:hypothetical protein
MLHFYSDTTVEYKKKLAPPRIALSGDYNDGPTIT